MFTSDEIAELKAQLESNTSVSAEEINIYLPCVSTQQHNKIECNHHLISCSKNEVRERDLLKFLRKKSPFFILFQNELEKSQDVNNLMDFAELVRNRFRIASKSGESGELILFAILESNSIIQLLNKFRLKTSKNVNVQGADAVHIKVTDEIAIFYGESKMHSSFNSGLSNSFKSIDSFYTKDKEDIEVDLISSNIDEKKFGKFADKIIDILNPYSDDKNNLKKIHPILICFDWNIFKKQPTDITNLMEHISEKYTEKINELQDKIINSFETYAKTNNEIANKEIVFYILPFKKVTAFNEDFLKVLNI